MILLLPLSAAGAVFMRWLTPFGVGIYVDSLYYVSSAQNLLDGNGIGRVTGLGEFKPMTHYPPFYSLVLAFFQLLGINDLTAARWISILAFGIAIILVGLIVYQRTNSGFFSALSALLILSSNLVLRNFSWAMTEPLYIILQLASILFFGTYLHNYHRRWLVFAAVFASLALLTRYVGFSLVGALFLILILDRQLTLRQRIQDLGIFFTITLVPMLLWLVRNWLVSESLTNRMLRWHSISSENIAFFTKAVNSWGLLPQRIVVGHETFAFVIILCGLALVSLVWLVHIIRIPRRDSGVETTILFSGYAYTGLLTLSLFFLDVTTRLENRILLPLYILILLIIVIGMALLWQPKSVLTRLTVIIVCLWLAYFSFTRVDGAITDLRADGQGYASLRWQNSPTAGYIRLHDTSVIYTNDVTAIYFIAGKDSVGIPNASATDEDFFNMREIMRAANRYLVLFGILTGEIPPLERLTQELTLIDTFADGTIYQLC